jgi:RND family efflux transporter MFP subunit
MNKKQSFTLSIAGLLSSLLFCTSALAAAEPATSDKSIPVTVTTAVTQTLEEWQLSQGKLLAKTAPMIAAEVGGRIISVKVDVGQAIKAGQIMAEIDATDFRLGKQLVNADIKRLHALIKAQQLQVKRFQKLVRQKSANQSSLDDAEAQLGSLQAQLVGARVRLQQADRNITKARITSPVDGRVTERKVSVGDYLNPGTPVFRITTLNTLQARLPFPQALASRLQIGQTVHLTSPIMPGSEVVSKISEISPEISPSNLAINVIIDVENPGGWEPGASVSGKVRVAEHQDAVVVAEGSIIRRPAGLVVYKIEQGKALEIPVTTGLRKRGRVEILSGVQPGDRLALDGAAYLTDGVSVDVKATTSGDAR